MNSATIIQGRKLFKGGNYYFLGLFKYDNYSRETTIQGRKLFAEIRYLENLDIIHFVIKMEVKVDTLEFQIQHYA